MSDINCFHFQARNTTRKIWLDYSRAFACVLVSLGHLLKSFEGNVLSNNSFFTTFFVQAIYHFHVYIFFFCGGYLFQTNFEKCTDGLKYVRKKLIRCIDFFIPYVIFSFITYFVKSVLGNSVNTPIEGTFFDVLFVDPINQMWYLYAIIVITIVTPVIRSNKSLYLILSITLLLKLATFFPLPSMPLPISYWMQHQIWFVLGMVWSYKHITLKKFIPIIMIGVFVALCILEYAYGVKHTIFSTILTFCGVISTVEIIRMLTKGKTTVPFPWDYLSKYMFQIYLLHTIFAAGIRIILLKLSIDNLIIHLILGLIFSFVLPVIFALIAQKTIIANIVFFPSKTIKTIKTIKQRNKRE